MSYKFQFDAMCSISLENSFGVLRQEKNVEVECTYEITDDKTTGWFEFYDTETGGEEWYAEGQLWFEDGVLVEYDGVFSLPDFLLDDLEKEMKFDVSEMR